MPQVLSAVKAIICSKNRFLVLKHAIGNSFLWDIPGGKIKFGESPYEALFREIKEETGLDVEIIKLLGLWWYFRQDDKQVICTTFVCKPLYFDINLFGDRFRWMTKIEFLSEKTSFVNESLKVITHGIFEVMLRSDSESQRCF